MIDPSVVQAAAESMSTQQEQEQQQQQQQNQQQEQQQELVVSKSSSQLQPHADWVSEQKKQLTALWEQWHQQQLQVSRPPAAPQVAQEHANVQNTSQGGGISPVLGDEVHSQQQQQQDAENIDPASQQVTGTAAAPSSMISKQRTQGSVSSLSLAVAERAAAKKQAEMEQQHNQQQALQHQQVGAANILYHLFIESCVAVLTCPQVVTPRDLPACTAMSCLAQFASTAAPLTTAAFTPLTCCGRLLMTRCCWMRLMPVPALHGRLPEQLLGGQQQHAHNA
jgi:hypothetical protein